MAATGEPTHVKEELAVAPPKRPRRCAKAKAKAEVPTEMSVGTGAPGVGGNNHNAN